MQDGARREDRSTTPDSGGSNPSDAEAGVQTGVTALGAQEDVAGFRAWPAAPEGSERIRCVNLLLQTLESAGVDTIYGIPGGSIGPFYDALMDHPGIKVVTTRQDGGAVFGAAGYAQTSGSLGVAVVTSGPGLLNAMNAIASAYTDGQPVLIIAGEAARDGFGRGAVQEGSAYSLNLVGMLSNITKLAVEIPSAHAAAATLRRAMGTALSGKRGPVVVSLPLNLQGERLPKGSIAVSVGTSFEIDPAQVAQVARAINAHRPAPGEATSRCAILAGSGCRPGGTPALLLELAERANVPVMTTPKAKGVFPDSHRLSLGIFGMGGHRSSRDYVTAGVDTLLVIGSSLNEVATDGWCASLAPRQSLIQVDIDALQLGRTYPVQLGIAAPAQGFLSQLLPLINEHSGPRERFGVVYDREARIAEEGRPISAPRALFELQKILPANTIYTGDSGANLFYAVHYLRINEPDSFVSFLGLGSMGSGLPAAIGAQMARPDRTVCAVMGDGGFLMCAGELSTASQLALPLVVAVLNDQKYGMVEFGLKAIFGRSLEFAMPFDLAQVARGMGADVVEVRQPGDILACALTDGPRPRPLLFDIHFDAAVGIPTNRRFETITKNAQAEVRA